MPFSQPQFALNWPAENFPLHSFSEPFKPYQRGYGSKGIKKLPEDIFDQLNEYGSGFGSLAGKGFRFESRRPNMKV